MNNQTTSRDRRLHTSLEVVYFYKEIELSDKLQGSQTAEVVVLCDDQNKYYGIQPVDRPDFLWGLDYFLSKWSDLKITMNILKRSINK
jgi:hypothetical protein